VELTIMESAEIDRIAREMSPVGPIDAAVGPVDAAVGPVDAEG